MQRLFVGCPCVQDATHHLPQTVPTWFHASAILAHVGAGRTFDVSVADLCAGGFGSIQALTSGWQRLRAQQLVVPARALNPHSYAVVRLTAYMKLTRACRAGMDPAAPQLCGSDPLSWLPSSRTCFSVGIAPGWPQLAGSEPGTMPGSGSPRGTWGFRSP